MENVPKVVKDEKRMCDLKYILDVHYEDDDHSSPRRLGWENASVASSGR